MPKRTQKRTVVARAFIVHRGRVLLTRTRDSAWYFLPGGHVDPDELIEGALSRELREEFGVRVRRATFIGLHDNHFDITAAERHHELGVVFSVAVDRSPRTVLESHITFEWAPVGRLGRIRLMPLGLGAAILHWRRTRRPFWIVCTSYGVKGK